MKIKLQLLAVATLLLTTLGVCSAMDSIEPLSKERVKALGMVIRSKPAGPDAVWVELEFEVRGELKDVTHVGLEMWSGKKLLLSATLRDNRPSPGHVAVSFTAARSDLDKLNLRVLSDQGLGSVGYQFRVKDVVDSETVR